MDSLTHIVTGACIGEIMLGKHLGKKAMLLGALAQSIPDIDFIASSWLDTANDLLAHRGFTHSILFAILLTPILSFASVRWQQAPLPFSKWASFWGIQIFLHLFIDVFNNYGTGLFEPFSHTRVSFNAIYVADPLFTIWPLLACVALIIVKKESLKRRSIAWWGIVIPACYLLICLINKEMIDSRVKKSFTTTHIPAKRYFSTPTTLNNILWYVVAESDSGYYIGYASVFDREDVVPFSFRKKNKQLLTPVLSTEETQHLIRFSQGYYTAEQWNDTLVFNDLRFGQIGGWRDSNARFVFYIFLNYPEANKMVVQRGRIANIKREVVLSLWSRMKGN